jgi:hypothetical protein
MSRPEVSGREPDLPADAPLQLIWGAKQIGDTLGLTERQCFHLLQSKRLPARKVGGSWVADLATLRRFFSEAT